MSHKATAWLAGIAAADLGHSEFRVLFHLCDCHHPANGCFPSQAYLIANSGASNGTVNNVLNSLEAKGLIQRHRTRDGKSKRQKPTRYILGFEIKKPQEPTPNSGDGKDRKPTPNSGDGAVSNPEADPSPTQRPSRLQPTGEEPVSKPVNNLRTRNAAPEILKFWAKKIEEGGFVPQNAVTEAQIAEMLKIGLVSQDQIAALGLGGQAGQRNGAAR